MLRTKKKNHKYNKQSKLDLFFNDEQGFKSR